MIDYDPSHWVDIIFSLRGSVVKNVLVESTTILALGLAVGYLLRPKELEEERRGEFQPVDLASIPVGFFFVFRTDIVFQRYMGARDHLGRLMTNIRVLLYTASTYYKGREDMKDDYAGIVRLITLFFALARRRLSMDNGWADLPFTLSEKEEEQLRVSANPPALILTWLMRSFTEQQKRYKWSGWQLKRLVEALEGIEDPYLELETLKFTPIPIAYAQLAKVILVVYLFTVPFLLVQQLGTQTAFSAFILTVGFFAVERIGNLLEDPFGDDVNDLPMGKYVKMIKADGEMVLRNSQFENYNEQWYLQTSEYCGEEFVEYRSPTKADCHGIVEEGDSPPSPPRNYLHCT